MLSRAAQTRAVLVATATATATVASVAPASGAARPAPFDAPREAVPARAEVPEDRFAMAGGCYGLQAPDGRWVTRSGNGFAATAPTQKAAEPFPFKATDFGSYLLHGRQRDFLAGGTGGPRRRTS